MAARRDFGDPSRARPSQLWQFPLFLLSVGLFGYAAYLFINPGHGATIDQKIDVARGYLKQERPDAALEQLNKILAGDKLQPDKESQVHLLIAEALDDGQKQKKIGAPVNDKHIIEQTHLAIDLGAKADGEVYRRLAEAYESLGETPDALQNYRLAIAMDAPHALRLRRRVIELQLGAEDTVGADASLDEYLKSPGLADSERAWSLAQKAGLLIDRKQYAAAKKLLADALKLNPNPEDQGQFNFQLGYCAYKEGQPDDAERYLRLARDQLTVRHPLDADAGYWLGRILQERNDPQTAEAFYQSVLTSHPESKIALLARLGRGMCRLTLGETDAGLTDLHDLVGEVGRRGAKAPHREDVLEGLRQSSDLLAQDENYQAAMEVLAYEQEVQPVPQTGFFARLGRVYEKRADQLEASLPDAAAAEKIRRAQQVRELRTKAGDAYVAYSRALTLADDKGYGDAMWRGIDLYDRAGNLQDVISALELFTTERPDDRLAPDAVLRLGRAYQAAGLFDKAIAAFQRNMWRYPKSLAASKSAVPLAQAYVAKGPGDYAKAEKTLLSVVENNPLVDPKAEEFRESLFQLAQLYYRTGRYEEAIARLEELTQRYPDDERMPQLTFLMADSYRKSATLLDVRLASAGPSTGSGAIDVGEAVAAKRDRLTKARTMYDKAIDLYRVAAPTGDEDKLYQKLSHFYRADCLYDLGEYEQAIKLYDAAAFRYQEDPSALAAYVQIVNAYCALGKTEEAKAANERAKWMLKHMPPDSFRDGSFSMPKAYWEQWLKWTSDAGMW